MTLPHIPPSVDPTGIIAIVLAQLRDAEERIVRKIDDNALAATSRWKVHEREHEDLVVSVRKLQERLDAHLRSEEDDALVVEARLGPIRRVVVIVYREWRTLAIIALIVADFASRLGGTH